MSTVNDESYNDTIFLRFSAIILILNSHLDLYYPIKYIGTGGAIGNTLFFLLSSYGLFKSFQKKPQSFQDWYSKRIIRIYPPVWLTLLFISLPIAISSKSINFPQLLSYLGNFYYPPYWFLQALMIFYIVFWVICNNYSRRKVYIFSIVSITAYVYLYLNVLDLNKWSAETIPIKIFYYLIVFLVGILIAKNSNKFTYRGLSDWIVAIISFLAIYGHKYLITKKYITEYQFAQQVFCLILCIYLIKISRSTLIKNKLMGSIISPIIKYISAITLEIYIIHSTISAAILSLNLSFPANVALLLLLTFLLSIIISYLSSIILRVMGPNGTKWGRPESAGIPG